MKRAAALAFMLLAGCQGVDGETYMGVPGSPAWFSTASPNTIAAYFSKRCTAYGFQPGTPEMAQCIQNEAASSRMASAQRSAAIANANAAFQANAAANRPRYTSCNRFGNSVNCTTY